MSFWGAHEFRHNPKNRPPKKIPHEDCTAGIKVLGDENHLGNIQLFGLGRRLMGELALLRLILPPEVYYSIVSCFFLYCFENKEMLPLPHSAQFICRLPLQKFS